MTALEFIRGKWLEHPIHPIFVHIPASLLPAALLFDVLSRIIGSNTLVRLAFSCICLGLLGAVVSVPFGFADWTAIKKQNPAWKLGLYHMGLNILAVVLFAISFGLRLPEVTTFRRVTVPELSLSVAGTVVLLIGAYLGGRMVFHYGIGVARFSKSKWRRRAEMSGSQVPEES